MPDAIDVLLIDESADTTASILNACVESEGAGFRVQVASLESTLSLLDHTQAAIVLCHFDGDDRSVTTLRSVLDHAGPIPVVTHGPSESALASVTAGSDEHISPARLESNSLVPILQMTLARRRRWQATELSEARLHELIQAGADSLVIVDESGTVRFANRAAESLFNCNSDELVGSVMGTPSGDLDVIELSIVRRDTNETIAAEMRVVEIEWGGKVNYIQSIRDVTRQKQEAQHAREAIRMRDHFLATLSHELRNPLAALNNAAQVLSLEHGHFPTLKLPVEIIQRQSHHMVRLLDDLLDISRISQGKVELRKEFVSLSVLIDDCLQSMRSQIEQTHRLKVDLPTKALFVHIDPARIQQVLANLLTNAIKYTSPGGEITVRARQDANEAVLEISDEGLGIAPELLDSIFEPFVQVEQTLARSDGGLGIGLAVVRRLVELHGGRVTATSDGLGRGSQFTMRLPLTAPVRKQNSPVDPVCTDRFRICVVDDSPDVAMMMCKLLEMLGHEVVTALDGEQALELIFASPPEIVFLDIGLPVLDGYEIAQQIARDPRAADITLVALTGYGQPEDRERAFAAGFHDHLIKPVSAARLQSCLTEIAKMRR